LVIDGRWREVAETALTFVERFVSPDGTPQENRSGAPT
jgi:hypothetical protein